MDTKKNMSREQLLAYMRDNCTEAEAQQVRMWLRERLKDPGLDQLFSDLLDATETEYDPEGKELFTRHIFLGIHRFRLVFRRTAQKRASRRRSSCGSA